jgi:hypothetical protein
MSKDIKNNLFLKEDAHWYKPDGTPVHTVIGKNGKERPTTIRDAIKDGYWPSVTSYLSMIGSAVLDNYKQMQVLKAALANPKPPEESDEEWCDRIVEESQKDMKDAAFFGSRVHKLIEEFNLTGTYQIDVEDAPLKERLVRAVESYIDWYKDNVEQVVWAERVMTSPLYPAAGTCDFGYICKKTGGLVIADFKTKKTKEGKKVEAYTKHAYQLAAYAFMNLNSTGQPCSELKNLFISSTEPGRFEEWSWSGRISFQNAIDGFNSAVTLYLLERGIIWDKLGNEWRERST